MPKDSFSFSPPSSRMSDVALRKKKNADAQAAFRARRANYISTLEETVNNLESVVLQLQESCREARSEAQELRQENARVRQAFRERESLWRAMWPRKHSGDADDPLPPPPPPFMQTGVTPQMSSSMAQYPTEPSMSAYRSTDDPSVQFAAQNTYSAENDVSTDSRTPKYTHYFNTMSTAEATGSHTNSPHFVESPTLTSPVMAYGAGRYNGEDQKAPLNGLDTTNAYVFPASRSISPSSSTPPQSTAFNPLASSFSSTYADQNGGAERTHFDYRRQSGEVMLHGGTADISLAGSSNDAVRYRLGTRRDDSALIDRGLLPVLPPLSTSDNSGSPHEGGSDDNSSIYPSSHRLRARRGMPQSSRSPSPDGSAPLSGTLAVIKAQAFGALRRTRARSKKSDGASKVSIDVLEARGLGTGINPPPAKRQRLNDDLHDS